MHATQPNEIRARFITALRRYKLTGSEFRIVIALNDLHNSQWAKAWPSQDYLREATGVPIRTIHDAVKGLRRKGVIDVSTTWLSGDHSRLEYRIKYSEIIGRDPGYPKRPKRPRVQIPLAETRRPTGENPPSHWQKSAEVPAETRRLSSLVSSLGNSLEPSLERKWEFDEGGETRSARSLREFSERRERRYRNSGTPS